MTWKDEINDILWGPPKTVKIGDAEIKVARDVIITLMSIERDIDRQEITEQTVAALKSAINRLQIVRRILERG